MKTIKAKISKKVGHWQHPETGKVYNSGEIVEIPEALFHIDAMERVTPKKKVEKEETPVIPEKEEEKTEDAEVTIAEVGEDKKPKEPKSDPKKDRKKKDKIV